MTDQPDRPTGRSGATSPDGAQADGDDRTVAVDAPLSDKASTAAETTGAGKLGDETVALPTSPSPSSGVVAPEPPPAAGDQSDDERTVILDADAQHADDQPTQMLAPTPSSGRPRLVLHGQGSGKTEFPLTQSEVTIGRASDCGIVLSAPTVSRQHARITQRGGEWVFTPVGGYRNTFVNDELVTQPRLLHDGDRIQLADERLVYRVEDEGPPPSQPRTHAMLGFAVAIVFIAAGAVTFYARDWGQPAPRIVSPGLSSDGRPGSDAAAGGDPTGGDGTAALAAARDAVHERQRAHDQPTGELERQQAAALVREREERIRKLLYEADVAFIEYRYTTPPDGSAVYAYREVLEVDPSNERALSQTAKIIHEYLTWAENALADGRRHRARLYASKAAYVHQQIPAAGDATRIGSRLDALRRSLGFR
ncbi:MAG: FHA domain-containing protein [Candidatus Binatia bacterium]